MLSHATSVRNHIRSAFLRTEYELNGLRDDPASRERSGVPKRGARGAEAAASARPAAVAPQADHADAA